MMCNKKIDLPGHAVAEIVACAAKFPEVQEVVLFGSRVLGNAKIGSDVDLAVCGENVTSSIIARIHDYLEEETNLPYFFDVVHFESIQNSALREHVISYGCSIYKKDRA